MPTEFNDNVESNEHSIDEVAASLLVKPDDKREPELKTKKVDTKEPSNEETDEDANVDEQNNEEGNDEEAADETADNSEAEDEEDVDVDELEIDVTVDGQEKKVKLKDLKSNYSGNSAIEKRLQEASEIRTKAMDLGKHLHANLQAESERLVRLDEILKNVAEPDVNWEELKRTNLPKYLLEREKQQDIANKRKAVADEKLRVKAEQDALEAKAHAEYMAEQAELLVKKLPDFGDREKATQTFGKLAKAAQIYGYAPEEVGSVIDHRAMLVLNDAMKYQELTAKQKEVAKKTAPATALLRPGTKPKTTTAKKLQEALTKKARATGKVEDVAATLLVRKK